MHERVQIEALRTSDPATVQVLASDAMRRPLGQLAPTTVVDLFALSEVDSLPKPLARDLHAFVERITHEVRDTPNGSSWDELLAEFRPIDASRVPVAFRAVFEAEAEREERDEAGHAGSRALVEQWSEAEPEVLSLPEPAPKPAPATRSTRSTRSRSTTRRTKRPPKPVDEERIRWIQHTVLERLAGYSEAGLAEPILVAGVIHRASDTYDDLTPYEITSVLKDLKKTGQLRLSAGRWRLVSRW